MASNSNISPVSRQRRRVRTSRRFNDRRANDYRVCARCMFDADVCAMMQTLIACMSSPSGPEYIGVARILAAPQEECNPAASTLEVYSYVVAHCM
eukprot:2396705-Pyramimonas_sp.AAC.2